MFEYSPGARIAVLTALIMAVFCGGLALYGWTRPDLPLEPVTAAAPPPTDTAGTLVMGPGGVNPVYDHTAEVSLGPKVMVHVAGHVKQPGLYRFAAGARVQDALDAAGGATAEARVDDLNLAAPLTDGLRLYVPGRREAPEQVIVVTEEIFVSEPPSQAAGPSAPAPIGFLNAGPLTRKPTTTERKEAPRGKVNLNKASSAELQTLPGVGPALAGRIIAYRSAVGPYAEPAELQRVRGIGPKTYEKLAPYISAP